MARETLRGEKNGARFRARFRTSDETAGECRRCGRDVRRSWATHILHSECRVCRYLVMMYGPSIEVRLLPKEEP
jgi:hypothetical protein